MGLADDRSWLYVIALGLAGLAAYDPFAALAGVAFLLLMWAAAKARLHGVGVVLGIVALAALIVYALGGVNLDLGLDFGLPEQGVQGIINNL